MKREAWDHPKLKHLARDLSLPMCFVRGIVESLWGATAINFPRGDVGRWSNDDIAVAIDYPGDADQLIAALVRRRLLDEIPEEAGRLYVHDWHEHCDRYVNLRLLKRRETYANGSAARRRESEDGEASRDNAKEREGTRNNTKGGFAESRAVSPKPEPEPERVPEPEPEESSLRSPRAAAGAPPKPVGSSSDREKRRSRRCPPTFELTEQRVESAIAEGLHRDRVPVEFKKFRDKEFRDPHSDWDATWRNWVRNAVEWTAARGGGGPSPRPPNLTAAEKTVASGDEALEWARRRDAERQARGDTP